MTSTTATRRASTAKAPVRMAMVGCGGMARHHARAILKQPDTTQIAAICEPSPAAHARFIEAFQEAGVTPPPNQPDFELFLSEWADQIDAAFIITPHVFHHAQAKACLEAGVNVLLEKPMVMNAAEALSLIETRDRTGRTLTVSFNGSLSPQVRTASAMLRSGELGAILNLHAVVWQSWKLPTTGAWRQIPEIAGGGFLFDTGAHLLNTVSDLVGEEFVEVAAFLDNRGAPVDILGSVMARTASGALVTMSGCGDAIKSCDSDVRVFCEKGIIRTGVWGERLELQREGEDKLSKVRVRRSLGQWEQFVRVLRGEIDNPCPPEVGLRMARLWDMIKESAAQGGQLVRA